MNVGGFSGIQDRHPARPAASNFRGRNLSERPDVQNFAQNLTSQAITVDVEASDTIDNVKSNVQKENILTMGPKRVRARQKNHGKFKMAVPASAVQQWSLV